MIVQDLLLITAPVCPGNDETLIGALALGLDSAVGSTYNFMPQVEKTLF